VGRDERETRSNMRRTRQSFPPLYEREISSNLCHVSYCFQISRPPLHPASHLGMPGTGSLVSFQRLIYNTQCGLRLLLYCLQYRRFLLVLDEFLHARRECPAYWEDAGLGTEVAIRNRRGSVVTG
jgi:hypothetical protein